MKHKFLALLVVLVLALSGCSYSDSPDSMPEDAIQIVDKGNGWVEFTLDGHRFLFYKGSGGQVGYMALTDICHEPAHSR